mmetsp:Transcript_23065/g.41171  ORF Transcript_23065/g.41171 Transcript_23065/m.41171 type:complete len:207 (+) Transcript_23065:557-1177(+)
MGSPSFVGFVERVFTMSITIWRRRRNNPGRKELGHQGEGERRKLPPSTRKPQWPSQQAPPTTLIHPPPPFLPPHSPSSNPYNPSLPSSSTTLPPKIPSSRPATAPAAWPSSTTSASNSGVAVPVIPTPRTDSIAKRAGRSTLCHLLRADPTVGTEVQVPTATSWRKTIGSMPCPPTSSRPCVAPTQHGNWPPRPYAAAGSARQSPW